MKPIVTVIIPCFNGEAYVREAIDSALNQQGVSLELIAIDDGSTDKTREILGSYGDRIRRIYQENAGAGRARNAGIATARGEYIALLDCDDVWLPGKLTQQMERFEKDPELVLVYTDSETFSDAGVLVASKMEVRPPFEGDVLKALFNENFITISSVIVRKESLVSVGGFREDRRYALDYDLWLRLAERHRFGYVNEVLVRYRIRPGRLSDNAEQRNLTDVLILKESIERVPSLFSEQDPAVRKRFGGLYLRLGRRCLKAGENEKSRGYLVQSLRYYAVNPRVWLFLILALLPPSAVRQIQAIRGRS